ncbi:hypothetical protein ASE35_04275 [Lysobacter sp. Root916]|uniref:hypothetical protein n=1 Tax=Lysobacter sp. Root916 TaxID=1736606 RepID=UPI000708DA93|nr:hypothetical protein [Lysobacter sp. Root916]KRD39564.1 hypothetical protein ASE35_04275 [Lysobacter sp. Root916]
MSIGNKPSARFGIAAIAASALLSACASFAVSDDALVQRTGFALGMEPREFTISNRMDEGTTTRYQVKASGGRTFNCFVGGSVSVLGKSVSEAVCTETGKGAGQSAPKSQRSGTCNALLKAAGKC